MLLRQLVDILRVTVNHISLQGLHVYLILTKLEPDEYYVSIPQMKRYKSTPPSFGPLTPETEAMMQ